MNITGKIGGEVGLTAKQFVIAKYKSARLKRIAADAWYFVFRCGSFWAIGGGKTSKRAWINAAKALKEAK